MNPYPAIIPASKLKQIVAVFSDLDPNKPVSAWDIKYVLTRVLNMSQIDAQIDFDKHATPNDKVVSLVKEFLGKAKTLEAELSLPIIIFQDGVNAAYNAKFSLLASTAIPLCDLNAKLDPSKPESYRANRQLLKKNHTYLKMVDDAKKGREFNDIIVEYDTSDVPEKPLKVWGGQHRISAISEAVTTQSTRYHGFRIFFNLSIKQRSELALISNTNMGVSNDTFDRIIEETVFGNKLRDWARLVGLLGPTDDFPDSAGKAGDKITVKRTRSFIVNFYLGQVLGGTLTDEQLDVRVYDPYLTKSGVIIDPKYKDAMDSRDILKDDALLEAGKAFCVLHLAQIEAITKAPKLKQKKAYRTKALIESVLCGWSFVAGLLQSHPVRLANHYRLPKTDQRRGVADPLNANEMSTYKHDLDKATYRGLGTRSSPQDRQRVAQLFLAKSAQPHVVITKDFMDEAVSQVFGILSLAKGYAKR